MLRIFYTSLLIGLLPACQTSRPSLGNTTPWVSRLVLSDSSQTTPSLATAIDSNTASVAPRSQRRNQRALRASSTEKGTTKQPRIGKCKKCSFYYAPATVITAGRRTSVAAGTGATAAAIARRAGPALVAADGATFQTASGHTTLNGTPGNGAQFPQRAGSAASAASRSALAVAVTSPFALALGAGLLLTGGIGMLVWYRRRKRQTPPIASST